ncbi:MAG: hypothetical protein JJE35_08515 [Thermoleophilia bacterium]|nr:hypothetical protein [Thermoleophilia bacterium]
MSPSDQRRLDRRRRGRLVEALNAAEEQLTVAEGTGCVNDSERLRTEIHGRDYVDFAEGLRAELHLLDVEGRDRRIRELCGRRGVSVGYLADLQRRHDRAVGLAPDQNPGKLNPDYNGLKLRTSTIGSGVGGGQAR